jgi:tetratricopeptide (TPR) repeat protein
MTHRAFVSSTFDDLKEHRAHVIAALRHAGIDVDPMEEWTAATDEPKQFSQDRMKGCDLCVLLVGWRRGHVPDGARLSITQLEYRAAVDAGLDVLVFMLKEDAAWPRKFDELDKDPEIRSWRNALAEHRGVGFFDNLPNSIEIAPALTRWVAEKTERARGILPKPELEGEDEWLKAQCDRIAQAFASRMSGGDHKEVEPSAGAYIERLVRKRGAAGAELGQPFPELAERAEARWVVFGDAGSGKSAALLRLAMDAAEKGRRDRDAPIPFVVQLNFFDTSERVLDRVIDMIAKQASMDPGRVKSLWLDARRPLLFLMDGFNEVKPEFQGDCLRALDELLEISRHGIVITSRPNLAIARWISGRDDVQAVELVNLDDRQIEGFLARQNALPLLRRMENQLKELSRNPFMLWALVRSCADLPAGELPRNKGQLYLNLLDLYIFGEQGREATKRPPPTRYNYGLVKKPILSRLALEMAREGVTRREEDLPTLKRLRDHLVDVRDKYLGTYEIKPYELMPDPPGAKALLDEVVENGVLRRVGNSFEFMHQSIQDCFAAMALENRSLAPIVNEIPDASWVRSTENAFANEQRTPLHDALVMLAGLLPKADDLVTLLFDKDPVLASECFGAAQEVGDETTAVVLAKSQRLLHSDNEASRYAGCMSIHGSRINAPHILQSLESILFGEKETLACKIAACTALGNLDDQRAVDLYVRLLGVECEPVQQIAVFALIARRAYGVDSESVIADYMAFAAAQRESVLTRVPELYLSRPSVDELVHLALAPEGDWRPAFCLLRLFHRPAAVEQLCEIILHRKREYMNAMLRLPLLAANETVAQALLAFLDEAVEGLDDKIAAALGIGSLAIQNGNPILKLSCSFDSDLQSLLMERLVDRRRPYQVRAAAALGVAQAGDLAAVLDRVRDPTDDEEFRGAACRALALFGPPSIPSWICSFVFPEPTKIQKVREFLVERALEDESENVRNAAAQALGHARSGDPSDTLIDKLNRPEVALPIRVAAANALAWVRTPAGRAALLSHLTGDDESDEVRVAAAFALAKFDDQETPALLEEAILHSTIYTGWVLAIVLSYKSAAQRGEDFVDRLLTLSLDDERDLQERLRAVSALAQLPSFQKISAQRVAEKLHEVVLFARDDTLRWTAARWAFGHKPTETVARLRAALADRNLEEEAREAAAIGLTSLGAAEAKSALEEVSADLTDVFAAGTASFALKVGEHLGTHEQFSGPARLIERAFAHLWVGSAERGIADFNLLIDADPDKAVYYWGRSLLLRIRRQYDGALADALKAAELSPQDESMQSNLGAVYSDLERHEDAIQAYRRAVELRPDFAAAHAGIASAARAAGRLPEALASGREAARLAPENHSYQADLGWYAYEAGEFTESIEASGRAVRINPNEPMAFFNLGLALLVTGDAEAAAKDYDLGLDVCARLSPEDACANLEGALSDLEKVSRSRPELSVSASEIRQKLTKAQSDAAGRVAERHGRSGFGFHPQRRFP